MPFKPVALNQKTKNQSSITQFKGVDYASQKFNVSHTRAIDLNNFYFKDGIVQVRQGTDELFKIIEPTYYGNGKINSTNFNGLWTIKGEDKENHLIAHIGHLLYEIKDFERLEPITIDAQKTMYGGKACINAYEFKDVKSNAFVGNNRLYFLDGSKFMILRFLANGERKIYPVEESVDVYIPTTSIGIVGVDMTEKGVGGIAVKEKPNLLTQWRKNKLFPTDPMQDKTNPFFEYILDGAINPKNENDMKDFEIIINNTGEKNDA